MAERLSDQAGDVLAFVRQHPGHTVVGITKHLYDGHPGRGGSITRTLKALQRRGLVIKTEAHWSAPHIPNDVEVEERHEE